MRRVLFVQGGGADVHDTWDNKLADSLRRELGPAYDLGARLPAGVPVLLYHGEQDDTLPVAHVELYARAIPQARVRRLAGRDHQLGNNLSEVARDIRELDI